MRVLCSENAKPLEKVKRITRCLVNKNKKKSRARPSSAGAGGSRGRAGKGGGGGRGEVPPVTRASHSGARYRMQVQRRYSRLRRCHGGGSGNGERRSARAEMREQARRGYDERVKYLIVFVFLEQTCGRKDLRSTARGKVG